MTGGHICLANVVCMLEVSPLAPIEQCQPMVALNSIGSKPTPAGDIVLRTAGHFLQQLLEAVSLGLARECMLALVVLFLIRNYYFFVISCIIAYLVMVTPGGRVVIQAVVVVKVLDG